MEMLVVFLSGLLVLRTACVVLLLKPVLQSPGNPTWSTFYMLQNRTCPESVPRSLWLHTPSIGFGTRAMLTPQNT